MRKFIQPSPTNEKTPRTERTPVHPVRAEGDVHKFGAEPAKSPVHCRYRYSNFSENCP